MDMQFDQILARSERLHFIGAGGSGMCPLIEILLAKGKVITGSDVDDRSDTVNRLRGLGVSIAIGQRAENIPEDTDIVVYTAAIAKDNPELVGARERGICTVERSIMLGSICRLYERTIAICGTHGKTTATSMTTQILYNAGIDPSVIIGGKLPLIGGNGRSGGSDIMVCEACEFVDTFLQITPAVAVILNIDADHLEYFGSVENIIKSFSRFVSQTTQRVIVCGDDANSMKAVEGTELPVLTFGFGEGNDYRAVNVTADSDSHWTFDLLKGGQLLCHITLKVPGHHNVLNALAAAAASDYAGATPEQIAEGLAGFTGAGRRFEVHIVKDGITIADDYAHHPAELEATLTACCEMPYKRVRAVFQPFTYSRTKQHLDEFARVLSIASEAMITEIMAAREPLDPTITSAMLQQRTENCTLFGSMEELAQYAIDTAQEGDLIITMGCGDIYKCAKMMKKLLEDR